MNFDQVHVTSCVYFIVAGSTITAEIQGVIDACVKLTGMPDLTLSFMVKLKDTSLLKSLKRASQPCYQALSLTVMYSVRSEPEYTKQKEKERTVGTHSELQQL